MKVSLYEKSGPFPNVDIGKIKLMFTFQRCLAIVRTIRNKYTKICKTLSGSQHHFDLSNIQNFGKGNRFFTKTNIENTSLL